MIVGVVRIGAQRASFRQRLTAVLAGTLFATVFGFAVGAANPAPAAAYTPPYYAVETYYLKLVNCTRTGGWVLSDGTCKGYGSGRYSAYVPPLKLSAGLSSVARVWAKKLLLANACRHGDPSARLRAAGYTSGTWGENIGCGNGVSNAHHAVLLEPPADTRPRSRRAAGTGRTSRMRGSSTSASVSGRAPAGCAW